jgi:hypothetical protein
MWRLVKYLEENGPALVASVREDHAELAEKLAEIWPGDGGSRVEESHFALAGAIVAALWLGRQAQLDKEAGDKRGAEQFFREAIAAAFETGKQSAMMSPP